MTIAPQDLSLEPTTGEARSLDEWLTTFSLFVVVIDPFTYESSWILKTAKRLFATFQGAGVRVAWLVAGATKDEANEFLGPLGREYLTFADPDRAAVKGLGVDTLPALVHVDQGRHVTVANGWDPEAWRDLSDRVAELTQWISPTIPGPGDPVPFPGTPALG